MEFVFYVATALAAFIVGTFEGPHIVAWFKSLNASRAVKAAQALIAKAEADAAALEAARKVVATKSITAGLSAAAVAALPTGPTGTSKITGTVGVVAVTGAAGPV
jgi:hypothetical protein